MKDQVHSTPWQYLDSLYWWLSSDSFTIKNKNLSLLIAECKTIIAALLEKKTQIYEINSDSFPMKWLDKELTNE